MTRGLAVGVLGVFSCVAALPGEAAASEETVGFVLEVRGGWRLEGQSDRLRAGQVVPVGAAVLAEEPKGRSRIVIALADGSTVAIDCSQGGACVTPLRLPEATGSGNGFWTRALSAAAALLGHPPQRYVATMARGVNAQDGVARLEDGTLDLHAIAGDLPAGKYSVRLDYVNTDAAAPAGSSMTASLASPDAALVQVPGLDAGLLEIGLAPEGNPGAATSAWVLAVAPQGYEAATEAFESATLVASGWEGEARARSVRSFLRAFLETLCSSAGGERCPSTAR